MVKLSITLFAFIGDVSHNTIKKNQDNFLQFWAIPFSIIHLEFLHCRRVGPGIDDLVSRVNVERATHAGVGGKHFEDGRTRDRLPFPFAVLEDRSVPVFFGAYPLYIVARQSWVPKVFDEWHVCWGLGSIFLFGYNELGYNELGYNGHSVKTKILL